MPIINYFFSPSDLASSILVVSEILRLKPLIALPNPSPIWGSLFTPKIKKTIMKIIKSSVMPSPNIKIPP